MAKNVLVVGAGGLGCELVKILSRDPINNITVIDDDTIDKTNLNRQFYYQLEDIGQSKAECMARKILKYNPNTLEKDCTVQIKGIHSNIKAYKRVAFYKSFDIVYCCLDNNEARSFVNARCSLAGVQLVDGGSAGWLGQSFSSEKECFDCIPKKVPVHHPICMIRSHPRSFQHCLLWAEAVTKTENIEALAEVFQSIANPSISFSNSTAIIDDAEEVPAKKLKTVNKIQIGDSGNSNREDELTNNEYRKFPWGTPEECLNALRNANEEKCFEIIYMLAFERARKYRLKIMSKFDAEGYLRNIIPSVCTTNSMVAALMVFSAYKRYNYFLVESKTRILRVELNDSKKYCLTCSVPVYLCSFNRTATVWSFLKKFKSEMVSTEAEIFDSTSTRLLHDLDGCFGISYKRDLPHRIYFEEEEGNKEILIKRIK